MIKTDLQVVHSQSHPVLVGPQPDHELMERLYYCCVFLPKNSLYHNWWSNWCVTRMSLESYFLIEQDLILFSFLNESGQSKPLNGTIKLIE